MSIACTVQTGWFIGWYFINEADMFLIILVSLFDYVLIGITSKYVAMWINAWLRMCNCNYCQKCNIFGLIAQIILSVIVILRFVNEIISYYIVESQRDLRFNTLISEESFFCQSALRLSLLMYGNLLSTSIISGVSLLDISFMLIYIVSVGIGAVCCSFSWCCCFAFEYCYTNGLQDNQGSVGEYDRQRCSDSCCSVCLTSWCCGWCCPPLCCGICSCCCNLLAVIFVMIALFGACIWMIYYLVVLYILLLQF